MDREGLFREQQRLATGYTWSNGLPQASPEKQRGGPLFYGLGDAVVNRVHWRKIGCTVTSLAQL